MLQILSFLWHLGGIRQSHQDIFFCGCKEQQISMEWLRLQKMSQKGEEKHDKKRKKSY